MNFAQDIAIGALIMSIPFIVTAFAIGYEIGKRWTTKETK